MKCSLPSSIADELANILDTPHPVAPYDHLKAAVVQRKSEAECNRPPQLLHRMRQLLGNRGQDLKNPLFREPFFRRLLQNTVLVLAATDGPPLDQFVELADPVADYSWSPSIALPYLTDFPATTTPRTGESPMKHTITHHIVTKATPVSA